MMNIPSMKSSTKSKQIESLPEPDLLLIPLLEKFGSKPDPIVSMGENVLRFQIIANSPDGPPGKIHSPVSGTVEKIEEWTQVDGSKVKTVFIRNNKKGETVPLPMHDKSAGSAEELLSIIEEAGIAGLGGAQFPAAVKYDRKGKKVETFIINGAECEPYLTSDYALMRERTEELLEGILIINRILEARKIVIAFEHSDRELEDVFNVLLKLAKYGNIRTRVVPDEYPQGGELQLAKTITGKEIRKGSIPMDHGVVVSNVGTVLAVYDAVVNKKPLVERVITVSGENAGKPGNYLMMIGTPVGHILETCGIDPSEALVVAGGPMMSPQVTDLTAPMNKGSLGIIALPQRHIDRMNCIWCGYCADVCPMKLMPMNFDKFFRQGKYSKMNRYDLADCIECGACEYICPSKVPLIESIKKGKSKLKEIRNASR